MILFSNNLLFSQVGINNDGSQPDSSAILDVSATNKGIQIPRLTETQRNALLPVAGLTIYNLTSDEIEFFNGSGWRKLVVSIIPAPEQGTHVPGLTQIVWNWNPVTGATGYKWNTTNNFGNATNMFAATTKTDTGLTCNTAYTRFAWAYGICGNSDPVTLTKSTLTNPPATPTAGTHVAAITQIQWKWNTVSGATGYKWNTTNSYSAATDIGTVTTMTETGLTSYTIYSRYVWAYSACGNSTSVILQDTTCGIPPSEPTAGTHVPSPGEIVWNWNPVSGATGYKWSISNSYASATNMGTAVTKTETGLFRILPIQDMCGHITYAGIRLPLP